MRALIQRVASASCVVEGAAVGEIGRGLVVLVGVGRADTADDVAWTVNKVLGARLFEGPDGRAWGASARALALPLLVISQFTLHASLDMVDLAVWSSPSTYLKVVDRHNEQLVSAYVTPGGARFLVLHDARNEDGIRAFCTEVDDGPGWPKS